ncbi:MAG: hypothetical protein Q7U85_06985 [Rhodocyclaceae bacterium]|nr:hypothetical protein [Rhodocyclaceae bacterium]
MEVLSNRSEITARIRKEVSAASTGTLLIRSSDLHIAMLGFDKGVLVSLHCEGLRSFKAIPRLAKINAGTCRFDHSRPGQPQDDLPLVGELLAIWEGGGDETARPKEISQEVIARIAQALVEYLGPVAPMLCNNLVKASGGLHGAYDVEVLIEKLASEIDNDDQRRKFTADARRCWVGLG